VKLIEEALLDLGGKGTGADITDWIGVQYPDLAINKKKLAYTVNAILSSKKYKTFFIKDTVIKQGGHRAVWKLNTEAIETN
jgi:hypothetical protein